MVNKNAIIKTYAIQSRSLDNRLNSTSGGTFFEIAQTIIEHGGYVCAAGFDSAGMVAHKVINTKDELFDLQGSKYVQSNMNDSLKKIRDLLQQNKLVLFVGTPCQVAGIRAFLNVDYPNLYLIDLICFGVPSPKVYKAWINEISNHYSKKVDRVFFRDKSFGYSAPNVKIVFSDHSFVEQSFIVKSYMKTFMNELNVRPSCSECKFKGCERVSDITMGDCWHIGNFDKSMDDNIGTTSVFVHTLKGFELIDFIKEKVKLTEISTEDEIKLDGKKMITSVKKHSGSEGFYSDVDKIGYFKATKKWVPDTVKDTLVSLFKRLFGKTKLFKCLFKALRG